ncbi:hypothetical protein RDI61_27315, partial [Pseudomonas plecoglossicida]|uniref:hypothetical protein n=2 Tax=Pseudomonas TaxID=286 RepID=UPI0028095CF7
ARLDIASYKQGGRAGLAQAILARNKCRSGFTREAPRGRRSISQALNLLSREPGGARSLGARLDIASYKQGGRAGLAQAILARNKRRSGFTREAPRGRRSISQALNLLSREPGGARSQRRYKTQGSPYHQT